MILGLKTELKLNNQQRSLMLQHAGVARHAYNQGLSLTQQVLAHNKVNPDKKTKFPSAIDLHKWLVASVKSANPWYYSVSKCAPQWALRHLREAWDKAFEKKAKPPRFKKKGQHDSFTLDGTIKLIDSHHIQVPKLGRLKSYERLPVGVKPKNVTISRQAYKWFISFKLEIEPTATEKTNLSVGVDLGVKHFATLSDGEKFDVPTEYKRLKAKISQLQYLNRRTTEGSRKDKKFKVKVANLHYRIDCIRKDWLNKLTTKLVKSFKIVCIEDLNVSGMLRNRKLAGAIAELGWYEFRRQLEYKVKLLGSQLSIVGRWQPSSKTCSYCDYVQHMTLRDRMFNCESCKISIDRDVNAALNIECWGLAQLP